MIKKTRYIVPFKYNGDMRRLLNLQTVKTYVTNQFPEFDLCVVEQGEYQIDRDSLFIYNNKKFNKSWALNLAVKKSIEDGVENVILGDADFICDKIEINQSINYLSEYECVSPFYQKVTYLKEDQSNNFIINKDIQFLLSLPEFKQTRAPIIPFAAGIVCFKTEAYKKIGGYPENFEGWGGEDDVVSLNIVKCLKYAGLVNGKAFHLYHEDPTPTADPDRFIKVDYYKSLSKEDILQKASENWDKLGNINLYKK